MIHTSAHLLTPATNNTHTHLGQRMALNLMLKTVDHKNSEPQKSECINNTPLKSSAILKPSITYQINLHEENVHDC